MEHHYRRNKPSQRQLQVGSSIYRLVTEAISMNESFYTRFHNVCISGVRMNSGLKQAVIIFTTSSNVNVKIITSELNKMSGYFRKLIAQNLNLRYVPDVSFLYDKTSVEMEMLQATLEKMREE